MLAVLLTASLMNAAPQDQGSGLLEPVEIRAFVVRPSELDVLRDPATIGAAMERLAEIGFNAVVPVAFERGRTLIDSAALSALGIASGPAFPGRDVLGEIVFEAHRVGLEVLVGIDGASTLEVGAKLPEGFALASGSKDRPDPRVASTRAAARAYTMELARHAEIDGFVLWNGLTAFTREETVDAAAKSAAQSAVQAARAEFDVWREELRAFDKGLVVGWAAIDPRFAAPTDAKGLDFLLFPRDSKALPEGLTAWVGAQPGRAARAYALDDDLDEDAFLLALASAREKPFAGEMLSSFAALNARDGLLADALNQGFDAPYYARATLPWRGGIAWRPAAQLVPLFNDSGTFTKVGDTITFHRLEAGLPGNASWSMKPVQTGSHELWVYLPPGTEELPALPFTIVTDTRRARRVTHPAGIPRGWTRIARAWFSSELKADVLRLEIAAGGTRAVAIGPLVALPSHRPD